MKQSLAAWMLAMTLAAQPPAPAGSIRGVVREAGDGKPVAGVTVRVLRGPAGSQATTDAGGRYTIGRLPAGSYTVIAETPLQPGSFPVQAARSIELSAGEEFSGLDFEIQRRGEIAGRVVDQNKEPASGVSVYLVAREYAWGGLRYVYAGLAETNDEGEYTLRNVFPGRAYVVAAARVTQRLTPVSDAPANPKLRRPAVISTYYPGTPEIEGAQPLVLRSGERREGVDIALLRAPAYCVSGMLDAGRGPEALAFQLRPRRPASGASGDGAVFLRPPNGVAGRDGKIRICDLGPGEYELTAHATAPPWPPLFYGSRDFAITDSDVSDFRVTARPRVTIPGEVVWDASARQFPEEASLSLHLASLTRPLYGPENLSVKSSAPGTFSFEELLADEYALRTTVVAKGAYVKEITYAGRSIRHEPLRAGSEQGDASLRIVLAMDGATVTARVADGDGKAVTDAHVVVMPAGVANEAALADAMVTGRTSQHGRWTSGLLAPGKYYVLASLLAPDKSRETIARLWRARLQAREIDLAANAQVQVELPAPERE